MFRFVFQLVALGVLLHLSATPFAQDEDDSVDDLMQTAGSQLQQQDYKAAAVTLRKVVEQDEDNPIAWQLLGFSLHLSGDLDAAIPVHEKAATFDQTRGIALYNLGCAWTLKSDHDRAFDYLNQAVAAGFQRQSQFDTDGDLDPLRDDVRFQRLMARVRGDDVTDDFTAKSLLGEWLIVSETVAGSQSARPAELISVNADTFRVRGDDAPIDPVPYKVDTDEMTPTIAFAETMGILRLNDGLLTLCYEPGSAVAPDAFTSSADNGRTVVVLRRMLTPRQLAGTWVYTAGLRAGAEIAGERLAGEVTVTQERFRLPASPTEFFVMQYQLTAADGHTGIDLTIESGPVSEGTAIGIIGLEGDSLTLCYDPTGQTRPTSFDSTPDDGFFVFRLERKADTE